MPIIVAVIVVVEGVEPFVGLQFEGPIVAVAEGGVVVHVEWLKRNKIKLIEWMDGKHWIAAKFDGFCWSFPADGFLDCRKMAANCVRERGELAPNPKELVEGVSRLLLEALKSRLSPAEGKEFDTPNWMNEFAKG
jgi:hypothetical protein